MRNARKPGGNRPKTTHAWGDRLSSVSSRPLLLLTSVLPFAFSALPLDDVEHRLVQTPVGGQHVPPRDVNGPPVHVRHRPPASATISAPAAMSHGFRSLSQKPSMRPAAT